LPQTFPKPSNRATERVWGNADWIHLAGSRPAYDGRPAFRGRATQRKTRMSDTLAGLSFEDALAELERIVRGLEGGQQKLEDAITCYERGTALRRHCEAKLAEAEARVQAIVERADGSLVLKAVE
jgi:exodeoxyribonuclease VII small subunit